MTELFIRVDDAGRYQCYRLVNGLYRLDVGPSFTTPREAIDYCKAHGGQADDADWIDRFDAKVDRSGGPDACWPWTAGTDPKGYGHVWILGSQRKAHRVALALSLGRDLADDELACHTCDNPPCCNPRHLYAGNASTNVLDMVARDRAPDQMRPRTHCANGHELVGDNLRVEDNGHRHCRACAIAGGRAKRAELRAQGFTSRLRPLIDQASRPGQPDLARMPGTHPDRRDAAGQPEAPAPQEASTSRCAGCGGPLPPGRHGQTRRTCSAACRRAAARRAAAETARLDTDGAVAVSHLPRPSEAEPHPGQSSSARESAVRPAVAPVCRAGARDDKRSRRARAAHSTADPSPRAVASEGAAPPLAPARGDRPQPVSEGHVGEPLSLGLA